MPGFYKEAYEPSRFGLNDTPFFIIEERGHAAEKWHARSVWIKYTDALKQYERLTSSAVGNFSDFRLIRITALRQDWSPKTQG